MKPDPASVYVNWAMYAIYGKMAEADHLRRTYPDEITEVANELARRYPIKPAPLYRGILLEDASTLRPDPNLTFLSWSEDLDVARWFGSPESYISVPFAEHYPEARGYVLTAPAALTPVLWHHSWRRAFRRPLEQLALAHPSMGAEGHRQIKWSLDTQHEVITVPPSSLPIPEPIETVLGASIAALDERLSPPWAEWRTDIAVITFDLSGVAS